MKVAVVGAGIAGLVAARELAQSGAEVVVLEGSDQIGGKLRLAEVAGVAVDVGAEATLARRPEALELFAELGLTPVHPTAATSQIWAGDRLRPMAPSMMGAPTDLTALAASGLLSEAGLARAAAEADTPGNLLPLGGDIEVGRFLEQRYGAEVVDKLVEPLLGGVYAGRAREISLRAAVPQLAAMAERGALTPQLAALPARSSAPVFAGLAGGMGALPRLLAEALDVRRRQPLIAARRVGGGQGRVWSLSTPDDEITADAVVIATPAWATVQFAAGFLGDGAGQRSTLRHAAGVDHASVAVITHAFAIDDLAGVQNAAGQNALDGSLSGFLVPPSEGRQIKASTFSFAKWDWVRQAGQAAGVAHLRTSVGRHREVHALDRTDNELIAASLADLAAATGLRALPVDSHVQRWPLGLPQYPVGHLARMAALTAALEARPGLTVAGAAYQGVGVPAVIASARRAAAQIKGFSQLG